MIVSIDGLKSSYKQSIINAITLNHRVKKIVLFGSRATGMFTASSDIDLVLHGEELTFDDLADIIEGVKNLTVPHSVDIHIHHQIKNVALLAEIKKDGVVWYERK